MDEIFDVVVVGAGVAGLNIAQLLGRYNLKVCLIDSKKDFTNVSFNTLGSFIDLDRFGFTRDVIAAEEKEIIFHSKHFHIKKKVKAYILNKSKLYKELLDKVIQSKVKIFSSTQIMNFSQDSDGNVISVIDDQKNTYKAKIFIDASGVEGFFSRKFGLLDKDLNIATGVEYNVEYFGSQYQTHLFIGKLFQGGYAWLFPLGGNRAIFGFGSSNKKVKSELKERLDQILETELLKRWVKKDNEEIKGGTIPISNVKTRFVYKNVLCIGDSVSQVNPLVGEGHKFILEFGLLAAPHIQQALLQNKMELLNGYEKDWYKEYFNSYKSSKWLQVLADKASNSDFLSDLATLFLATKRDETFESLLSANITKRDLILP